MSGQRQKDIFQIRIFCTQITELRPSFRQGIDNPGNDRSRNLSPIGQAENNNLISLSLHVFNAGKIFQGT